MELLRLIALDVKYNIKADHNYSGSGVPFPPTGPSHPRFLKLPGILHKANFISGVWKRDVLRSVKGLLVIVGMHCNKKPHILNDQSTMYFVKFIH